ncbi:hypothetical protein Tco_0513214 [Tanacetum coccineum]
MAGAGPGAIARRAVDDLMDFSRETEPPKYMKFFILQQIAEARRYVNVLREEAQTARSCLGQLNAMIAKMEAMDNPKEVYDSLRSLRDNRRSENDKLIGLNEMIALAEEDIGMKEGHVEIMEATVNVRLVMALLPICGELRETSNSVHWEPMFILYCRRSIGEDKRLASDINRVSVEVQNVVNQRALFIEELDSLGVRPVFAKLAEFLKEIQMKDRETVAKLHILEREMELNASQKELFIQKLKGLMPLLFIWMCGVCNGSIWLWVADEEVHEFILMAAFLILDQLTELADSAHLQYKMKLWFTKARNEDESFARLMCDLCFGLRITLSKIRRLIAELEALGERGDVFRSLDHMREIVAHDSAKPGILEQLLAGTHVTLRLKEGYVVDMKEKE